MGMGEPFHNEDSLSEAVHILTRTDMFNRTPRSVLVSTVGIPDAMVRFAEKFPSVSQALSLHSTDPLVRERLIPLARRYTLTDLKSAVYSVNRIQKCEIMIEYLMLDGVNDSLADANSLIAWLQTLNARVNLIPYNAIDDAPLLRCSSTESMNTFAEQLRAAGYETTIRYR
ncbi:MAG: hypothetical protein GY758_02525 [Fuerstiella sp.]|nr:hypothetical protein [Fuerstiella sp.]